MNMFEEAKTVRDMVEMCKMTQSEIAAKLNVSQSYIANKIRLLQFSKDMQKRILESGLSERHARALLRLEGEDREQALNRIIHGNFNVAETDAIIDGILDRRKLAALPRAGAACNLSEWEEAVDSSLSLLRKQGVAVKKTVEKYGEITYYTIAVG